MRRKAFGEPVGPMPRLWRPCPARTARRPRAKEGRRRCWGRLPMPTTVRFPPRRSAGWCLMYLARRKGASFFSPLDAKYDTEYTCIGTVGTW